jgi:hypothetical protein
VVRIDPNRAPTLFELVLSLRSAARQQERRKRQQLFHLVLLGSIPRDRDAAGLTFASVFFRETSKRMSNPKPYHIDTLLVSLRF